MLIKISNQLNNLLINTCNCLKNQVEEISIFIDGMDEDVREVDKIHSHILSSPKPDESKRTRIITQLLLI